METKEAQDQWHQPVLTDAQEALFDSEARFKVLTDAMPQMVWSTLPDGYHDFYNAQWYEFTGVPFGSTDGEGWNGMFHPDDQERAWARWRHSLSTGEPYEIEYRLRRYDGEYRWTLGRALPVRNSKGEIIRWIGTCTDIHDAKTNAEQNEVLSRELSHRIKNIFAVIAGLIQLSGRNQPPELKSVYGDLTSRVMALGRAHNFARPHSDMSRPELPGDRLEGLLCELMRPYQSLNERRVEINCEDITVDDKGATPLALVFHELATNSAKYGALSAEGGQVQIDATIDGNDVRIVWREFGGPEIEREPSTEEMGFGTKLTQLSVEQQLGGSLEREWKREGLVVKMVVRHSHLHREASAAVSA